MKSLIKLNLGILFLALLAFSSCRNPDNEIHPTCFDEILNQGEERIDCGGPNCAPCQPSCDDRVYNQDEKSPVLNGQVAGIDCGGENCAPCSTCGDGIQNAHWVKDRNLKPEDIGKPYVGQGPGGQLYRLVMESGIDCGFPCPEVCPPSSTDGIQNGDEQGIDCGGEGMSPCPTPTCYDGIHNGEETGIDCGDIDGACPDCPEPSCNDGIQNTHIEINSAYAAGYVVIVETGIDCSNNIMSTCPICPEPTCFDGIQNGSETGIDCGGLCETLCDPEPNCNNGIQDGDETGIDCGGANCAPCPTCNDGIKNGIEFAKDCLDYPVDHVVPPIPGYEAFQDCAICPSCHDGLHNEDDDDLYELDIDCGGPNCPSCEQYVKVAKIGKNAGSRFMDQYTYNKWLYKGGITDTLSLDDLGYKGLIVSIETDNFGSGLTYMKVEANQGLQIGSDILIRTVTMFLPIAQSEEEFALDTNIPMANNDEPDMPGLGPCIGIGYSGNNEIPFIGYQEVLKLNVGSGSSACFTSYVKENETSTLRYTYNFGSILSQGSYVKGEIDKGSLRTMEDPMSQQITYGKFVELDFKLQHTGY